MAVATLGMPTFSGRDDEDLFVFIDLYRGYLHSIGVNPLDLAGGPPNGSQRALGILRSCMQGEAAEWFDRHLTGKNWKINNVMVVVANGNEVAFKAILLGAPAAVGTFRAGSDAANYAGLGANAALTIGNTMWSDELVGTDLIWRRSDGQVTDELPNFLTGAGPAVVAGGGNGVNPLGAANPY